MRCLHKIFRNALVEPWDPIEDNDPCPRPVAADALAADARLPWPYRRRADLRVPSARQNSSAARERFVSAEYLARSFHDIFAFLCVVHRLAGPREFGSTAHYA